jgi:hypothetical protein
VFKDDGSSVGTEQKVEALFVNVSQRSPNLRKISVYGNGAGSMLAITSILRRRWPQLEVLVLEDVPMENFCQSTSRNLFINFLVLHPTIIELRMPSTDDDERIQPVLFSHLRPHDLPHLKVFQGDLRCLLLSCLCAYLHTP